MRKNKYSMVSWNKRLLNLIIDTIFVVLLLILSIWLLKLVLVYSNNSGKFDIGFIFFALYFLYYLILETVNGQTIGKYLTHTKVVNYDGSRVKLSQVLIRTLIRLTALDAFSYISKNPHGWHDRGAGTKLIQRR